MSLQLIQYASSASVPVGRPWDIEKFKDQVKDLQASKIYLDIIEEILAAEGGKDWLASYLSTSIILQPSADSGSGSTTSMVASSKQSASANVSVASLIFYYQISLDTETCGGKHVIIKGGGVGSPGGGAVFGTLWYDSCDALQGDCDVQFNITSVAANINFIRSGYTFAYFVGGGIGTVNAIGGGSTSWG